MGYEEEGHKQDVGGGKVKKIENERCLMTGEAIVGENRSKGVRRMRDGRGGSGENG